MMFHKLFNLGFKKITLTVTKEQLENAENEFDIIHMSSVFHELMSYLPRPERN